MRTLYDAFARSCKRVPNETFLGSRDFSQEGAPYVWKTFSYVKQIVDYLAAGIIHLNLMPEVEEEGKPWRFIGIYAKNREEWAYTHLASLRQSGTTVAFYDTLGPASVEFVINQTRLTTIACSLQSLRPLIMLKSQGRAESVQNLICFDDFEADAQQDAEAAGLTLYHINSVIQAGRENLHNITFQEPEPQTTALFCYTSGTTGEPKAAKLSHENLISVAAGT